MSAAGAGGGAGEGACVGESLPGSGVTLMIPTTIKRRKRSSTAFFSIMVLGVFGGDACPAIQLLLLFNGYIVHRRSI